jgi:hypothetical protein
MSFEEVNLGESEILTCISLMREFARHNGSPSDELYRHVTLNYLNTLLGKTSVSKTYWKLLQVEVQVKFPEILTPTEQTMENFIDVTNDYMKDLMELLFNMTGIKIELTALE